jgi:thymidylate kinase
MIMDRCLWSTLAVHAAEKPKRLGTLLKMLEPIAADINVPTLTLVLEASFATCQSRIANKSGTARELDELTATNAFHDRERQFYRWLGGKAPRILFVDAEATPEQVADDALGLIRTHLPDRT